MQIENLITEHIDTWTSAVKKKSATGRGTNKKHELYGIKKLRELILELAVRGKLVPQDENDEPASVLLERIAEEKAKLVKAKKIKKNRKQPAITTEEIYFHIPPNWGYARLEDIYDVRDGTHDSPKPTEQGYPLVTSKNISTGKLDLSNVKFISEDDHLRILERSRVDRNDILFAMIGSIGNPVIVDIDIEFSIKNVGLFKYYNPIDTCPRYLNYFLKYAAEIMKKQSAGGVQPFVSLGKLRGFVMPTPPLNEQQRIVAKVDELMLLCDQLEQQTESSIDAHKTLVEVLLNTLTDAKDATELQTNWARVSEFFDTLFTTEHSIDQLKQTILQLAVMGKLVPQDPNDEPASKLLERIAAEKAQLIADKKIKKQKALPPITEEEKPFELPSGWEWCRLGQIINLISGQHLKPNEYSNNKVIDGIPYITGPAEFGVLHPTYSKYTIERRAIASEMDILITCKGAGLGKLNQANENIAISRQLMAIQPILAHTNFLYALIDSKYKYFQERGVGIAIPGMSREDVTDLVLMAPPLEEQIRIVDKIKKLMIICDQLKSQLNQAQQTQLNFSDALVAKRL